VGSQCFKFCPERNLTLGELKTSKRHNITDINTAKQKALDSRLAVGYNLLSYTERLYFVSCSVIVKCSYVMACTRAVYKRPRLASRQWS